MNIKNLGWNEHFEKQKRDNKQEGLTIGRILKENRHHYKVHTEKGPINAKVTGQFHYEAQKQSDYPTVGDWVLLRQENTQGLIERVLSRNSVFSRKQAGKETQEQVVAANIDQLCIVCSLDGGRNYNLRGIERYLTMTLEGGAKPVIVLNKADLCEDRESAFLKAQSISENIPIHIVSALTGEGMEKLSKSFGRGLTVAFTGHSGVGKSHIINHLLGMEIIKTGKQRTNDLRGRHTTTHKELYILKSGAMVIDTPGMRELQLWGKEETLDDTYREIQEAAQKCRFNDCTHQKEPGCAVQQQLIDGTLEIARYENYLDMRAELRFLESKKNEKKRHERKAREKKLSKLIRKMKKRH